MKKKSLEKYLEEETLKKTDEKLSDDVIKILKLARKYADYVYRITSSKYKEWEFVFLGTTFEGHTHIYIKQKDLTPANLLLGLMRAGVCSASIDKCNQAILEILES